MHVKRRLNRFQRAVAPHERTTAVLPRALALGAPLPPGAGIDAFALNTMGLGAGMLLRPFLVHRPARRPDRR